MHVYVQLLFGLNIFSCIPDEKNANKSKILAKVRNTDLNLLF